MLGIGARLMLLMINWFLKIFLNICSSTSLFSINCNTCMQRVILFVCPVPFFSFSISTCCSFAAFPFSITLIQTNQQTARFLIRRGNCRPLPQRPTPQLPPTLPNRWQGGRPVTACEECHVCRPSCRSVRRLRACLCQPWCQGSWACQLLHRDSAAAAAATHLQVNVFFCASASW